MPSYQLNKKTVNTLKLKTLSPADTQPTGLSWATNWLLSWGMMAAWRPVQAVRKRVSLTYRGWSVERAVKQLVDSGRPAAADWSPTARLGLRSHMQTHSTGWWCRTAVMLSVYETRYFSPAWDGWPSFGGHIISVCYQPTRSTQPLHPSEVIKSRTSTAGVKATMSPPPDGRQYRSIP